MVIQFTAWINITNVEVFRNISLFNDLTSKVFCLKSDLPLRVAQMPFKIRNYWAVYADFHREIFFSIYWIFSLNSRCLLRGIYSLIFIFRIVILHAFRNLEFYCCRIPLQSKYTLAQILFWMHVMQNTWEMVISRTMKIRFFSNDETTESIILYKKKKKRREGFSYYLNLTLSIQLRQLCSSWILF